MLRYKLITGILLILVAAGGYFGYRGLAKDKDATRYITAAVKKGTMIISVSGNGQVLPSDQLDIKPKVPGEVVYVGVKNGQKVKAGTLLVQIDDSDAQKRARDAKTSLETAKLELDKLLEPVDELDLLKAENDLAKAKESKQKAEDNTIEAYEDAFNAIANAFLDLPTVITGLRDILYSYGIAESETTISNYLWNISIFKNSIDDYKDRCKLEKFTDRAESNYKTARTKYDENFENYKNASRYSEKEIIEALLNETIEATKSIAETVKSETNLLDFVVDYFSDHDRRVYSKITKYQSDLKIYTSKTNNHLSSLLSIQRSLKNSEEAIVDAERSIKELVLSLAKLKAGADELDIRAKKIAIQQKEDALVDAQQSLADHYIRAPFDGVIANLNVKKGESVSSNQAVATLITNQKIAEITLNEIDIPKIKVGQKANITFDAIEDLNLTGEVVEIDALGTVNQGVVTYGVKIAFDTQDERVKPGMTLTANIITKAKQNALLIPSLAVKQRGNMFYVQIVGGDNAKAVLSTDNAFGVIIPKSSLRVQPVQVGLSNDTMTEILKGLKQGDVVITQTITSSINSSSSSRQSQQNIKTEKFFKSPNAVKKIR